MGKCSTCGKQQAMCACPKGSGEEESFEDNNEAQEKETNTGKIILLCGTSTAGKTSICTAAQTQANTTGHSWHIDGTDIAMDIAWRDKVTLDGVEYKSGKDHFINAMKIHDSDSERVERAAKVFGKRTLAVAVLSRQSLGDIKVDKVNLTPEEDIKVQAKNIYDGLSDINKDKYSADNIEDLLSIVESCYSNGDFLSQHPHPPLQNLYDNMITKAITSAKQGNSTILDVVGNEMINDQLIGDHFKNRLEKLRLPSNMGQVVVAHCPINTLISRIDGRNAKAIENDNPEDVRQAFFPFAQYGAIYEKTEAPLDSSRIAVGKVSRQDIIDAAAKFGGEDIEVSSLLDNLGFKDGDNEIHVTPKISCDQIYQTGTQTSEQIAKSICTKAFGCEPSMEDNQNTQDLRGDCSL